MRRGHQDSEMNAKLLYLKEMQTKYTKELGCCREGRMIRVETPSGTWNYIEVSKTGDCYHRRGITKDKGAIYAHARKRFLKEMLKILEVNISALERLQKTYLAMDFMEVIRSLPKTYQDLPVEAFFSSKWGKEKYTINASYPEHLRHSTLGGFKVRSKSELYIVDRLDRYQIPFRYEMELQLGSKCYYPDFTICNLEKEELVYWEHCGMVGDEEYMSSHYDKMRAYANYGIVPWKNLIVTYDDEDGNISAQEIDLAMKGLLLKLGRNGT